MTALAIGVFDGVHLGHQMLLRRLKAYQPSIVLTFSNHPNTVLHGDSPPIITSLSQKRRLLHDCGIDQVVVLPFTSTLRQQSFDVFLEPYKIRHLFIGDGATFGKNGQGTAAALQELGLTRGFTVHNIPKLFMNGKPVSSSRIRALIQAGQMKKAAELLGRPYSIDLAEEAAATNCLGLEPASTPPASDLKTAFGKLSHFALPPDGEYNVWVQTNSGVIQKRIQIHRQSIFHGLDTPCVISWDATPSIERGELDRP
jgi:FAD synthase